MYLLQDLVSCCRKNALACKIILQDLVRNQFWVVQGIARFLFRFQKHQFKCPKVQIFLEKHSTRHSQSKLQKIIIIRFIQYAINYALSGKNEKLYSYQGEKSAFFTRQNYNRRIRILIDSIFLSEYDKTEKEVSKQGTEDN